MSDTRATPLYCPYCGDEDLRPHERASSGGARGGPDGTGAAWECRSCLRVFALRMVGLLAPAAPVGPGEVAR